MSKSMLNLISESKNEISEDIKMKYFQFKHDSSRVLYNLNFNEPNKENHFIPSISAMSTLDNQIYNLSLDDANLYLEISQFAAWIIPGQR